MELIKKNIHMNREKNKAVSQFTLDDDFNVPDVKPDMGTIIDEQGTIVIEEIKLLSDHVTIKGMLQFQILYTKEGEEGSIHSMDGKIPFEEIMNLDQASDGDNLKFRYELEDLSTNLINSRKVSVKTIITFQLVVSEIFDAQTAVELRDDNYVACRNQGMDVLALVVNKKDIFRLREEIALPSNKPNIQQIIWKSVVPQAMDIRVIEDKISLKGEMSVFFIYRGEGEEEKPIWMESTIPFQGYVDCAGCSSDQIANIDVNIQSQEMDVKPDLDGEERVIGLETVLELDIRTYEEQHVEVLEDVYSPVKQIIPEKEKNVYDSLLIRNDSKSRVNGKLKIGNDQSKILQICHIKGMAKIDETEMVENGIQVEGALDIEILYVTSDDAKPFGLLKGTIPISQLVETPNIDGDCIFDVKSCVEQISAVMLDGEEIEVKSVITIGVLVIRKIAQEVIVNVREEPLPEGLIQKMPGMVMYIVGNGDTLWNIAKEYYTTMEEICQLNELPSETVRPGEKLLLVKRVETN